jgi:hypothetical protein
MTGIVRPRNGQVAPGSYAVTPRCAPRRSPGDVWPLTDRVALLRHVDKQAPGMEQAAEVQALSVYQQRAVRLLTSPD